MTQKRYEYPYRDTFTDSQGKRHDIKAKSKKELNEKRRKLEKKLERNLTIVRNDITLRDYANKCVDIYKPKQNDETKRKYRSRVNHCICEQIGSLRVRDVRLANCQEVMNLQTGKSKTQVNEVFQALKFIFKHALADGIISSDPTTFLEKPQAADIKSRRALTPEERSHVITVGKTDRRYYLFLLMLLCSCRPSEAAECKGYDITMENTIPMLHIRGTKTENSDRKVPIPPEFYDLLKLFPKEEYLAQTKKGNKITERARRRVWTSFKRQLNISMGCKMYRNALIPPYPLASDLTPYCFRHEYCTELARKGVDIREAQRLMGHSDITLTANIYTNLDSVQTAVNAAKKLGYRYEGQLLTDLEECRR